MLGPVEARPEDGIAVGKIEPILLTPIPRTLPLLLPPREEEPTLSPAATVQDTPGVLPGPADHPLAAHV